MQVAQCSDSRVRLGSLTAWHLPCGPVDSPATWAATSNVELEVEQSTYAYSADLRRVEREGEKGARDKQGCSPKKRSGGTPETRLRQRFVTYIEY